MNKRTSVDRAAALAASRLATGESGPARAFVAAFYEHAPPADIAARGADDLCGGALALWRCGARRQPGEARVRVYNPAASTDGWSSPHTIVEIVNDDMPFLVDSVTAAINDRGGVVRLVIHPIVSVARDGQGNLIALNPRDGGLRESWMQIEITREPAAAQRSALAETLVRVLVDVRAAVSDWRKMRDVLAESCAGLAASAAPLPAAELGEGAEFLRWLDDDNFVLLGVRDYAFSGVEESPPLGILREDAYRAFGGLRDFATLTADVRDFIRRRELLVISKTDSRSTVHRRVPMDAIGVRRFGTDGGVGGLTLFVCLFTSSAYAGDPRTVPLLRQKIGQIIARSGLAPTSHDGKALIHILDTFPRDELFQAGVDALYDTAIGILNLQERQRIALFVSRDPLERFVSCIVYVPRDRQDTALRLKFEAILTEAFAGTLSTHYVHVDDSALARMQFIIATTRGAVPTMDIAALEARLVEAGRSWTDRVETAATEAFGEGEAHQRLSGLKPFPVGYQAQNSPEQTIADLDPIDAVLAGSPLEAALHPRDGEANPGLRLYRRDAPVVLSDILPILENLGLRIVAEEPYHIESFAGPSVWVDEFTLADGAVTGDVAAIRKNFEEALVEIAGGAIENDGFNRLVLAAGLTARQTVILRLYCKVLRQAGSLYSQAYMEDTLARHAGIAGLLVALFERRFDPAHASHDTEDEVKAIEEALDAVESLDEDRILRSFLTLVIESLRTNYFQPGADGKPKPYLAVKFASSEIDLLPLPHPLYEIYVYSPRMEGLHMRAGRVARGGIRWSDRREDFRTEILGLMKAQTVKNAVIIPVGSKGGFVLKKPPADRAGLQAEGIECYKILMHGLLDLTDNIVADSPETHHIVPPPSVVRHDDDDPYLVVAADKGTATFSDIANGIAAEYGFWLGDAFASGGSAGYDHKELAITSRGAWELVKRHFRELARDIQTNDFTVVGVGDMSGDVFGNGMLRERTTRLVAAFDHRDIFIDPAPDPQKSFAERARLFELPRSSWQDYDKSLISDGGGVFGRGLKEITLSPQAQKLIGLASPKTNPQQLISALLKMPADLLWFGGIGTYVRASTEADDAVGDRANDAIRVTGAELACKVIGEGANLGMTQRGRIEAALHGVRLNTDAIDNSAGVNTSDIEVNIK